MTLVIGSSQILGDSVPIVKSVNYKAVAARPNAAFQIMRRLLTTRAGRPTRTPESVHSPCQPGESSAISFREPHHPTGSF